MQSWFFKFNLPFKSSFLLYICIDIYDWKGISELNSFIRLTENVQLYEIQKYSVIKIVRKQQKNYYCMVLYTVKKLFTQKNILIRSRWRLMRLRAEPGPISWRPARFIGHKPFHSRNKKFSDCHVISHVPRDQRSYSFKDGTHSLLSQYLAYNHSQNIWD